MSDQLDADDLEQNAPDRVLTSKSQHTRDSQSGLFKWNISGVQEAVSGAMSGLSAYIGWVQLNNSDNDKQNPSKEELKQPSTEAE